jgi:hypothetical protein
MCQMLIAIRPLLPHSTGIIGGARSQKQYDWGRLWLMNLMVTTSYGRGDYSAWDEARAKLPPEIAHAIYELDHWPMRDVED